MSLERIEAFIDLLYEEKICDEFDRIIPIVADESMGKSTFILQFMVLWKRRTGQDIDVNSLIDQFVYSREGFKEALATYPPQSVIPIADAARALFKKESMDKEQIDVEKDLLDVRVQEYVILMGYQDWGIIPDFLQRRRAKNLIRIPTRGTIHGYNRDSLDEMYDSGSWPKPDMHASFPSLEGTELWREYKRVDRQKKKERIQAEPEAQDQSVDEIIEDIKSGNIDSVIGVHGGWNREYIDPDLIEAEYDLSYRKAKKVKTLLEKDDAVTV